MSALSALIHDGALAAGIGTVLYTATVATAALTALLARTPRRRRDARAVLTILLRRPTTPPE
ncbi:hypothetical protein [Virgisporangium aurantiacum]|uniref:Uncharacterized protein n=1 Tax=Virgisporangium aurantiacum TaxID=175570 RepID=A0A8J3ZFQ6_9ACTN|nr:hypothetical protein [Virgisporangium aurantiacum]GIJ63046.1 hypothetical protein Vau01_105620 [Virgisporangium aurantiacum]